MVSAVPEGRPANAQVQALLRLLTRRAGAGESFRCGVRVLVGTVPGEGAVWRFRRSVAEPAREPGIVVMRHGSVVLRLRLDARPSRHLLWPAHVMITGTEVATDAQVRLSCSPTAAQRLLTRLS
jgi:hypothetical protein